VLLFNLRHYQAVMAGQKTQTTRRRLEPSIKEGVVARAVVTHFADLKIKQVERKRLRDFTEDDAQREGGLRGDLPDVRRQGIKVWHPAPEEPGAPPRRRLLRALDVPNREPPSRPAQGWRLPAGTGPTMARGRSAARCAAPCSRLTSTAGGGDGAAPPP
jgi:uncharacterized protein YqfB (UPF0267 family)